MSFIRRIPIPLSALALGFAGLGNLLLPYSPAIRIACGIISALAALLVILRFAVDLNGVRAELRNPGSLAVLPTLFMALMLLSTYLKPYAATPAKILWVVALASQLAVVTLFFARFVTKFKLPQVLPSWFLIFVGFVIGSVTSPAFGMLGVGRVLLYTGLAGYAAVLPVIVFRLVKGGALPEPAVPTIAIFAAPPSLCLVGYLAVTEAKQPAVVIALLGLAGASLVFVLANLPRILSLRFHPSYAALTFPFVISAIALKQTSLFLSATGAGSFIPKVAITAMDVFTSAMVLYVLARYVISFVVPAEKPATAVAPASS